MSSDNSILMEVADHQAWITINRPETLKRT